MGTSDRKEKEKQIRTEDIIRAAERIFFSKGFTTATMDDIAKEAEYSKRTVYCYFSSKNQLYYAIVLKALVLLNNHIHESLDKSAPLSGLEQIRVIGQVFIDYAKNNPHYFKGISLIDQNALDLHEHDAIKDACLCEGKKIFNQLITIINSGIADNSIQEQLEPVSTAYAVYASVMGMANILNNKTIYVDMLYHKQDSDLIEGTFSLLLRSLKK